MSSAPLSYRVVPVHPAAHMFEVTLNVQCPCAAGQVLSLPTWIPGSYMIREFAKNIVQLRAWAGGREVQVIKLDKSRWQVEPVEGPLKVIYEVYAWDLSVRMAHLDQSHGFFNGTSVFLAVQGQEDQPHEVVIEAPSDPRCSDWSVATTLPRVDGEPWGFGRFRAADYDELVDHPVEMGCFERVTFQACGIPHHVVLTGRFSCDLDRLCRDLTEICEGHIRFFGEPAPVERYLFMVMVVGDGYGGLEHRASTALICKRDDLPQPGVVKVGDGYRQFLGLCSHEYFHTWNVKRIKPRVFVPYDLSTEAYTTLLWAFEGITSYYDDLNLLRTDRIEVGSWLELMGRTMTRVYRGAGRHKQSVAASSFDAWTKFYRQDENAPNAIVSYYAKGAMVAMALDLELRRRSGDRVSLDGVMRELWRRHGDGSGVDELGVERVAAELLGEDLSEFFDGAVRGTEDLPLGELLAGVGVQLHRRGATGDKDRGGKAGKAAEQVRQGELGARVVSHSLGAKLANVHDRSAAQRAGLSAGDIVVALDGLRVTSSSLTARVGRLTPGTTVEIVAFRRDELLRVDVVVGEPVLSTVWLALDPDVSDEVVARRERWLRGKILV